MSDVFYIPTVEPPRRETGRQSYHRAAAEKVMKRIVEAEPMEEELGFERDVFCAGGKDEVWFGESEEVRGWVRTVEVAVNLPVGGGFAKEREEMSVMSVEEKSLMGMETMEKEDVMNVDVEKEKSFMGVEEKEGDECGCGEGNGEGFDWYGGTGNGERECDECE